MTLAEKVVAVLLEAEEDIDWSSGQEGPDSYMSSYDAADVIRKEDTLASLRERVKAAYAGSMYTPQLKRTRTAFWYRLSVGGYAGRWERARREEDALAQLLRLGREYDSLTCPECGTMHGSYAKVMSGEVTPPACPECGIVWHRQ